jgi:hypothetical protein
MNSFFRYLKATFYVGNVLFLLFYLCLLWIDKYNLRKQEEEASLPFKVQQVIGFSQNDSEVNTIISLVLCNELKLFQNARLSKRNSEDLFFLYLDIADFYKNCRFDEAKSLLWETKAFSDDVRMLLSKEFIYKTYYDTLLLRCLENQNRSKITLLKKIAENKGLKSSIVGDETNPFVSIEEVRKFTALMSYPVSEHNINKWIIKFNILKEESQLDNLVKQLRGQNSPSDMLENYFIPAKLVNFRNQNKQVKLNLEFNNFINNPFYLNRLPYINFLSFRKNLRDQFNFGENYEKEN